MTRHGIVLALLAAGGHKTFTPVQIQKALFIVDKKVPDLVGGPHFNFQPYNYGPFDSAVYDELEGLAERGFVEITPFRTWNNYSLTEEGARAGEDLLSGLPEKAQRYLRTVADFVTSLSFAKLVSAIYKAFPDMRENSVFQA